MYCCLEEVRAMGGMVSIARANMLARSASSSHTTTRALRQRSLRLSGEERVHDQKVAVLLWEGLARVLPSRGDLSLPAPEARRDLLQALPSIAVYRACSLDHVLMEHLRYSSERTNIPRPTSAEASIRIASRVGDQCRIPYPWMGTQCLVIKALITSNEQLSKKGMRTVHLLRTHPYQV
jgi:hypothetical protein